MSTGLRLNDHMVNIIYLKRFRLISFGSFKEEHVLSLPPAQHSVYVLNECMLVWQPPRQPNGWPMRFYAILCMSCPVICKVAHGEGGWQRQWCNTSLFSVLYSSIIHEWFTWEIPDAVKGNTQWPVKNVYICIQSLSCSIYLNAHNFEMLQ